MALDDIHAVLHSSEGCRDFPDAKIPWAGFESHGRINLHSIAHGVPGLFFLRDFLQAHLADLLTRAFELPPAKAASCVAAFAAECRKTSDVAPYESECGGQLIAFGPASSSGRKYRLSFLPDDPAIDLHCYERDRRSPTFRGTVERMVADRDGTVFRDIGATPSRFLDTFLARLLCNMGVSAHRAISLQMEFSRAYGHAIRDGRHKAPVLAPGILVKLHPGDRDRYPQAGDRLLEVVSFGPGGRWSVLRDVASGQEVLLGRARFTLPKSNPTGGSQDV